eukprot:538394_1
MAYKNLFTQAIHCFTFFTFTSVAQTTWISTCNEALVTVDGSGYRGCQNTTIEGVPCAKWGSETPHSGTLSDASNPNTGLGDHNYCRNPDGHTTIWCYTLDPNTRWADCHPLVTSDPTISPTVFPSVTPTDNTYHPTYIQAAFPQLIQVYLQPMIRAVIQPLIRVAIHPLSPLYLRAVLQSLYHQ